jgi:predicted permease
MPIWLDALSSDLRYTMRGLRAHPGFTAAVVATLALGIGVNAAIFPVVDRLLFRLPPKLAAPELTNRVYLALPTPDGAGQFFVDDISYALYKIFIKQTRSFDRMAQYRYQTAVVGYGAAMRELPVAVVSATFFDFFDAPPAIGRYFNAAEDAPPAGAPTAVLTYDTWQTRYAGRSSVLGTTLRIGPSVYTVIGVAPRGFVGVWPEHPPIAFVPTAAYFAASALASGRSADWSSSGGGTFLVQRKPGVDLRAANADLTNVLTQIWAVWMKGSGLNQIAQSKPHAIAASLLTERGPNQSTVARVAALVGGMAVVVLLIACANVANLLLARAMRRRRETAVRLALGISRRRLVSQLLTESVVLSTLGGVAALGAGRVAGTLLDGVIVRDSVAPPLADRRTLVFVAIAVIATGILTGLGPAWMARRHELTRHLKSGMFEQIQRSRLRIALLVLQTAMSVLLLVGAGLFVRSLDNVRRQRLGYEPRPVLYVDIAMADVRLDRARAVELRQRLLAPATRLPSVEHAALEYGLPLEGRVGNTLHAPGIDSLARMRMPDFYYNAVSPDYFETMGTRILRGRAIGAEDAADAPHAIVVSARLAKLLWPRQEPLGRCVYVAGDTTCTNVVGIAEDIRATTLEDEPAPYYYLSAAQFRPERARGLVLRVRGSADAQIESIRRALQREMPGASYVTVKPFSGIVDEATRSWRLGATMFALFGVLALVLAAVGLYGVIAYNVTQRTHEIGVRVALGARGGDVLWLIVRQGVALGLVCVALGTTITLGVAGQAATLLFGVSARDPMIYASVGGAILLVAIAASVVPAYRAASVDPTVALRSE